MVNLFDREFYPTPPEVIRRMAAPYAGRLDKATVLEPSAGNGAILSFITEEGVYKETTTSRGAAFGDYVKADRNRCYAVERNPELQMILQQKGYRLIAADFLSFRPEHRFDLILMNPPFSNGDDHLLHAWEILPSGDIACLLNAETLRNPHTAARKRLARIIEENGSVEYIGKAFRTADNPTDVEVALVRLRKDAKDDPFRIDTEGFAQEKAPDFGTLAQETNQVAVNNQIDAYIRCWDLTKAAAVEFIRAFARLKFYASSLMPKEGQGDNTMDHILKTLGDVRYSRDSMASVYNDFIDSTKASAWNAIFAQIGLGKYMTTGLKEKLDEFRTAQGALELSRENINMLFRFIMTNIGTIMDQSVVEVYDLFTRFYKGNTAHDEGWKTNKRYRCNRKVILPNAVSAGYCPQRFGYDEFYRAGYGRRLEDIDKAMCWLTGRNYDSLENRSFDICSHHRTCNTENATITTAIECIRTEDQSWHESAFFRIRAFKKGTVHLEFKDEDLWNRFNIAVNKGKNEIGMTE